MEHSNFTGNVEQMLTVLSKNWPGPPPASSARPLLNSIEGSSQMDLPNAEQSAPGKVKKSRKDKGVNWYTHLPKGPPPKMTAEQQKRSLDTKSRLRAHIQKRQTANSLMLSAVKLEPEVAPQHRQYTFHHYALAGPDGPPGTPVLVGHTYMLPPVVEKPEQFPPHDPALEPLHVLHKKGEIEKAVDYKTCSADCWCGPPTPRP